MLLGLKTDASISVDIIKLLVGKKPEQLKLEEVSQYLESYKRQSHEKVGQSERKLLAEIGRICEKRGVGYFKAQDTDSRIEIVVEQYKGDQNKRQLKGNCQDELVQELREEKLNKRSQQTMGFFSEIQNHGQVNQVETLNAPNNIREVVITLADWGKSEREKVPDLFDEGGKQWWQIWRKDPRKASLVIEMQGKGQYGTARGDEESELGTAKMPYSSGGYSYGPI